MPKHGSIEPLPKTTEYLPSMPNFSVVTAADCNKTLQSTVDPPARAAFGWAQTLGLADSRHER